MRNAVLLAVALLLAIFLQAQLKTAGAQAEYGCYKERAQ
jgi:hypothetical protein